MRTFASRRALCCLLRPLLAGAGLGLVAGCGTTSHLQISSRLPWNRPVAEDAVEPQKSSQQAFRPRRRTEDSESALVETDRKSPRDLPRVDRAAHESAETESRAPGTTEVTAALHTPDWELNDRNPIELQGLQVEEGPPPKVAPLEWHQRERRDTGVVMTSGQSGGSGDTWREELERLIERAERDLAVVPVGNDPAQQTERRRREIQLRLLYLAAEHPEQALTAIPDLTTSDQEFWQQMVWAVTNSVDAEGRLSPGERAAQAISPLNTALRRLREQAELTIRNAAFCEEISYFGNYRRFGRDEFVPGQPVLFYAEIENFRSDPSSAGEYRTVLRSRIEFVNAEGQTVWSKNFEATEDLCRSPRRDYFHNYQFTIPERLRLGPHTLKLTVVDELSGKQATSAIKFVVK